MKLDPIITSLLEIDMYKLSMGQCIYHQFSGYKTTWTFKCRNQDVFFTPEMVQEIKGTVQVEGTVEVKGTVKVEGAANIENFLKRGIIQPKSSNLSPSGITVSWLA